MNPREEPSSLETARELHRAVVVNLPTANVVEVIRRVRPARLEQHVVGRLHVAGFVGGAARDDCLGAFPLEREAEARMALRQHRLVELRVLPALAAVGADLDARDLAAAGPGDA